MWLQAATDINLIIVIVSANISINIHLSPYLPFRCLTVTAKCAVAAPCMQHILWRCSKETSIRNSGRVRSKNRRYHRPLTFLGRMCDPIGLFPSTPNSSFNENRCWCGDYEQHVNLLHIKNGLITTPPLDNVQFCK